MDFCRNYHKIKVLGQLIFFKKIIFDTWEKVYQARLRASGKVVAIKVQRPGVRAAISLDILILRFLAGVIRRAGRFNTDLQVVWE